MEGSCFAEGVNSFNSRLEKCNFIVKGLLQFLNNSIREGLFTHLDGISLILSVLSGNIDENSKLGEK